MITFIGEADAAAASVSLPAFNADDLAVVLAFRYASQTFPSLPVSGWTNISTSSTSAGSSASSRTGYRILQAGDTDTGTWTNATSIVVVVVRGHNAVTPIGIDGSAGGATSSMSFPTLTLQVTDGTSWVLALGGHGTATDVNTVALAGTTNRSGATTSTCAHTAENVSTWSTTAKTVNAAEAHNQKSIEILASTAITTPLLSLIRARQSW